MPEASVAAIRSNQRRISMMRACDEYHGQRALKSVAFPSGSDAPHKNDLSEKLPGPVFVRGRCVDCRQETGEVSTTADV
jgi:hypothetical protein